MYRQYCKLLGPSPAKSSKQTDSPLKVSKQSDSPLKSSKQADKPNSKSGKETAESITHIWKEYVYGNKRQRAPFWERDRDSYRRLWRKVSKGTKDKKSPPSSRENSPEPPPKPKPSKEKLAKKLHIEDIDMNIEENAKNNKTSVYDCTQAREDDAGNKKPAELVVRRGNFMKITLTLDRLYDKKRDDLKLCFSIGKNPRKSKGTIAQFKVDEDGKTTYEWDEWGAYLASRSGNAIDVMVHIPADCIIGEWNFIVKTFSTGKNKAGKEKTEIFQYEHDADITIVFNPWCKEDGTYMEDEKLLNEYILNESGCVYQGSAWTRGAKPWNFGQFDDEILDICLYLVRSGFKGNMTKAMADPVKVSRLLAKMVNSSDDNGVLVGNWSGDYKNGTSPTAWIGSPKILRQFMETGPVRFGQCWVFSCLLTTVCRAVGIPCRSVTNFASAHDSNGTNSIEKVFVREDGILKKLAASKEFNGDSVWNFHVWNEVFLRRPDLAGRGYDGWQVIDATPQETSEGVYTCGPCPVKAIKQGDCRVDFDTGFVFSEVNADDMHLEKLPDETFKVLKLTKNNIGKSISTKIPDGKPFKDETYGAGGMNFDRVGYDEGKRLDLTNEYKYPEGSEQEREAVKLAHKTAERQLVGSYDLTDTVKDVEFRLIHSNEIMIGEPLPIELSAKNVGSRERNISIAAILIAPKTYIGQTGKVFFREYFSPRKLSPGEETKYNVELTSDKYLEHLVEQANLEIEATTFVSPVDGIPDSQQESVKTHDFRFRRPDLDVEGPTEGGKGTPVKFTVSFKNPLPVPLTGCKISMESSGFKNIEDQNQPDVAKNGSYSQTFSMVSKKKNLHAIVFSFDCKELKDITGAHYVNIV